MNLDAPWWTDWSLTTYCANVEPVIAEEPPVDWALLEELLTIASVEAPGGLGLVDGVAAAQSTQFLEPGSVPLGGWAKDQATSVIVNVEPDDSGIAPLIPYTGHPGSRVNPDWVMHKSSQASARLRANSVLIPPPDAVTIFSGTGGGPTWKDVWDWTTAEQRSHMTFIYDGATISGAELTAVADIVAASVIKAMGGMVNNVIGQQSAASLAIAHRVDSLQLTTYGAVISLMHDIADAQDVNRFLATEVIPNLRAQIKNLRESIPIQIEHAIQANNTRVRDAWITPLRNDVAAERQQRIQSDQSIVQRIPGIVRSLAPELLAGTVGAIAGIATRVGTLEKEAADCGRPICDMIGPKTALGKLLKGAKIAAELAALAAILNMTESDLANLIHAVTSHLAAVVGDIEQFTGTGGETVAGLIAAATRDLV